MFWLGTHMPSWLTRTDVPLFISRRRLAGRKRVPRALGSWALDSGAFSEISMHGRWTVTTEQYADEAQRWAEETGGMQWAATMDWMCEPFILAKTGLTVREHQRRTVASLQQLEDLAPGFPWLPVVQGWTVFDYLDHVEQYRKAGIHLETYPLVGVGSVCRRQSADLPLVTVLFRELHALGLRLHGFGLKITGLPAVAGWLASSDSMAWSYRGRRGGRAPECTHPGKCANCLAFALHWRQQVVRLTGAARAQWQDVLY